MLTICDRCGREIDEEEANAGVGEWKGATLCNDCFALVDEGDDDG